MPGPESSGKGSANPVFYVASLVCILYFQWLVCFSLLGRDSLYTKEGGDAVKRMAIVGLLSFFFLSSRVRCKERWAG